jgi:hypothetical protein
MHASQGLLWLWIKIHWQQASCKRNPSGLMLASYRPKIKLSITDGGTSESETMECRHIASVGRQDAVASKDVKSGIAGDMYITFPWGKGGVLVKVKYCDIAAARRLYICTTKTKTDRSIF